ncbi:hypothetical protein MTP09_03950 [Chryseobacterium suipulveris]|uniref:Uncharacterized protein n=1 Tax=Chryseobacterium suipulveris TaxID=2929800 RepID=A0ABY4BRG5_9FLAO|nr:hypothetical protein [Chryseobacterium suipulveris]UOE41797.1 hypothetical protein MTP09_03950 [Chryseobacterium suipulveris]
MKKTKQAALSVTIPRAFALADAYCGIFTSIAHATIARFFLCVYFLISSFSPNAIAVAASPLKTSENDYPTFVFDLLSCFLFLLPCFFCLVSFALFLLPCFFCFVSFALFLLSLL